ncbi:hypothetical protein [Legionella sp. W05-934-2]|uniref:hypothetical protein n=1 Tax=Legionella sp. W05-934-2 TaxID=1198649 RepID=UPI0034632797
MGSKNYYFIDNFADGNCGYLAYAISLMYVLRHAKDNAMTSRIIDKLLKVKEVDSNYLKKLIEDTRKEKRAFTQVELNEIQRKLGQPLREFAAEQVILEYQSKQDDSSHIFAVANYPMLMEFKGAIVGDSDIASYAPFPKEHDLSSAELHKLPNFARNILSFYIEHRENFAEQYKRLCNTEKPSDLTKERKIQIFDSLINAKTIAFFNSNNLLEQYRHRLATPKIWASEETMLCMHRAITNERMIGEEGHREFTQENPISFSIARDGVQMSGDVVQILLDNHNNSHWTSLIPSELLADIPEAQRPSKKFELRTITKIATTGQKKTDDGFPSVDVNSVDKDTIEKQQKLLELYANQHKAKKGTSQSMDNTSGSKSSGGLINPLKKPAATDNSGSQQTGTPSPVSTDDLEKERKRLFYLALVEGQRECPIEREIHMLLKEQEGIMHSLKETNDTIAEVEQAIQNANSEEAKQTLEQWQTKKLTLALEKRELEEKLRANETSIIRLLGVEAAEKYSSEHPEALESNSPQETSVLPIPSSNKAIPETTPPAPTGSFTLQLLFAAAKNIALFLVALLAGVGVGLLVASTGIGIPAAIGLGVTTTAVTGLGLYSLFNRGEKTEATPVAEPILK